jgi:hypothetical protein
LGLEESVCEGWLERKSGNVDGGGDNEKWKRRYFNLLQSPDGNSNWLFAYFKDSSMSKVSLVQTSYDHFSHKKMILICIIIIIIILCVFTRC